MDIALGIRIRALRKDSKMSQDVLAKAVGITFQQVQKYEHGTNRISFSRMCEIAKVLGVSPVELIDPLTPNGSAPTGKALDHFGMLRDGRSVELLTLFNAIQNRGQKTAVLNIVREMVRTAE
jgi:transcriptional regulator with XRE-family HTH domain